MRAASRLLRAAGCGIAAVLVLGPFATARPSPEAPAETRPGSIPLAGIVVPTRDEAEELAGSLAAGEPFEELARARSLDPSGRDGGFLGMVDPAELVAPAREAVRRLGQGETSPPVLTPRATSSSGD